MSCLRRRRLAVTMLALLALGSITCSGGARTRRPGIATPYVPPAMDWCLRIHGGPHGAASEPVFDLSAANAGIRFFGVEATLATVDWALARALAGDGAIRVEAALPAYARELRGVCVVAADDRPLGPARVERIGDFAVVHPGTGPVVLPAAARAVAIDLRELPAVSLRAALDAAVGAALATPVPGSRRRVRRRNGMDDEVFAPGKNVYTNDVATLEGAPLPAGAARELPMVLLTGPKMAPEAAEFAGMLRATGRAWIYGEDVLASVAESEWAGVGGHGLAWRAAELLLVNGDRWPDVIPADRHITPGDLMGTLEALDPSQLGPPPAIGGGAGARAPVEAVPGVSAVETGEVGLGELRAGLVIAHGALRMWFPYFAVVGDSIDERLLETLATAEALPRPIDPKTAKQVLARFGEAIHDGHNFVGHEETSAGDQTDGAQPKLLAVAIDQIGDEPVVMRSATKGINAGDTLVAIGEQTVADYYKQTLPRTSAATSWYRYDIANRGLLRMTGPTPITVRNPKGVVRTVTVEPGSYPDLIKLGYTESMRKAGFLGALGAKDIYYLNMSSEVLTDIAIFRMELTQAQGAAGLIVDMRGYPGINHYEVAMRLMQQQFKSPMFRTATRTGPRQRNIDEATMSLDPQTSPDYTGPIVLLVGPGCVSAAENFSIMLAFAKRVTVVGRSSAGTNGNITGVQLPGGFSFSFTGMELLFPDGTTFHGVGVVPDVTAANTAADYQAGRDAVLLRAIKELTSGAAAKGAGGGTP